MRPPGPGVVPRAGCRVSGRRGPRRTALPAACRAADLCGGGSLRRRGRRLLIAYKERRRRDLAGLLARRSPGQCLPCRARGSVRPCRPGGTCSAPGPGAGQPGGAALPGFDHVTCSAVRACALMPPAPAGRGGAGARCLEPARRLADQAGLPARGPRGECRGLAARQAWLARHGGAVRHGWCWLTMCSRPARHWPKRLVRCGPADCDAQRGGGGYCPSSRVRGELCPAKLGQNRLT